jgi:hypothetical protein
MFGHIVGEIYEGTVRIVSNRPFGLTKEILTQLVSKGPEGLTELVNSYNDSFWKLDYAQNDDERLKLRLFTHTDLLSKLDAAFVKNFKNDKGWVPYLYTDTEDYRKAYAQYRKDCLEVFLKLDDDETARELMVNSNLDLTLRFQYWSYAMPHSISIPLPLCTNSMIDSLIHGFVKASHGVYQVSIFLIHLDLYTCNVGYPRMRLTDNASSYPDSAMLTTGPSAMIL